MTAPATNDSHPLNHLLGHKVPGGDYSIAPYESWLAHDALYSKPQTQPHPIMAFVAAQRGMGCAVAEFFTLLESDINDAPLLASTSIEIHHDLDTNQRYRVHGEVTDLVRKHGAVLGAFDLVTCEFRLQDEADIEVAIVRNVYALGRQ